MLGIEVDLADPEPALAKLGNLARIVGATLRNTANPTMLKAGYKHNVIPQSAEAFIDCRFLPGLEDELLATIDELIGPDVTARDRDPGHRLRDDVRRGAGRRDGRRAAGRGPGRARGALLPVRRHRQQVVQPARHPRASASPRCGCRPTSTSAGCSTGSTSGCRWSR